MTVNCFQTNKFKLLVFVLLAVNTNYIVETVGLALYSFVETYGGFINAFFCTFRNCFWSVWPLLPLSMVMSAIQLKTMDINILNHLSHLKRAPAARQQHCHHPLPLHPHHSRNRLLICPHQRQHLPHYQVPLSQKRSQLLLSQNPYRYHTRYTFLLFNIINFRILMSQHSTILQFSNIVYTK